MLRALRGRGGGGVAAPPSVCDIMMKPLIDLSSSVHGFDRQGDQIGRNFAQRVIVYFGHFF
jgi:hypothetical protein